MQELKSKLAQLSPQKRAELLKKIQQKQSQKNQSQKNQHLPEDTAGQQSQQGQSVQAKSSAKGEIAPVSRNDHLALSFSQQRLWFLDEYLDKPGIYNIPIFVRLKGELKLWAMEAAISHIMTRHEILRTRFIERDGQVYQQIDEPLPFKLTVENLQDESESEKSQSERPQSERAQSESKQKDSDGANTEEQKLEQQLEQQLQQMVVMRFNLSQGPLLAIRLFRLNPQEHVLATCAHHIITDGWSNRVFMQEFSLLYNAICQLQTSDLTRDLPLDLSPQLSESTLLSEKIISGLALPQLSCQYADYAAWQHQQYQQPEWQHHTDFWKNQLQGMPALLELPIENPRPAYKQYCGENYILALDEGTSGLAQGSYGQNIQKVAAQQQVSPFILGLSVFALLMHRYAGQSDFAIGIPVANRETLQLEPLIGFFVNTLPIRIHCQPDLSFNELLKQVKNDFFAANSHQMVAFEQIVELLQPERNESFTPLFQVMFNYVAAAEELGASGLDGLQMEVIPWQQHNAKFDLTLTLEEGRAGGLSLLIEYDNQLFSRTRIERLAEHYKNLLKQVFQSQAKATQLQHFKLLSDQEVRRYTQHWNQFERELPAANNVVAVFEQQAEKTPDAIAIRHGEKQVSYEKLNRRANRLAHFLSERGVGADQLVSLYLPRSMNTIVASLAILKLRAAYLPLDLAYPIERLQLMRSDARSRVVLTHSTLLNTAQAFGNECQVLALDNLQLESYSDNNLSISIAPQNLAYVIYTSGSTGVPKGVAVSHESINGLVLNTNYVQIESDDRIAQASNTAFDAATFEIWGALLNGASTVIVERETSLSPQRFAEFLVQEHISVLFLTTALFNQIIQHNPRAFAQLRYLLFGGEAVDPGRVRDAIEAGKPQHLLHVYGPTETTTYASWHEILQVADGADTIPIGMPLSNNRLYVLDAQLNPVPPGVCGELYIGDSGLARGYLKRPGMSAEKFVPDPYAVKVGARMYRTGDVVRRQENGAIEFVGRVDQQVKIRGFRIELGEIEAAICRDERIRQATVIVHQSGPRGKHLQAYFSLKPGQSAFQIKALKQRIGDLLPDYMQPVAYKQLDDIPLNPNGKVDKRALPEMQPEDYISQQSVPPETPTEIQLAAVWKQLLGMDVFKRSDFFQSGGHSLLAMQLIAAIQSDWQISLSVREVFSQSQLCELAEVIDERCAQKQEQQQQKQRQADANSPAEQETISEYQIPVAPEQVDYPLSFAQERLYFLQQLYDNGSAYNMCSAIKIQGELSQAGLIYALNKIIERHGVLRTCFVMRDGQPRQQVLVDKKLDIGLHDISHLDSEQQQLQIRQMIAQESRHEFALDQFPLIRINLLQLKQSLKTSPTHSAQNSAETVLIVANHHILTDGWSQGIFMRELTEFYRQYTEQVQNTEQVHSQDAVQVSTSSPGELVSDHSSLGEPMIQYKDYAVWQREFLNPQRIEALLQFWRQQLQDLPPALNLHPDYQRPEEESFEGSSLSFLIEPRVKQGLESIAEANKCSTFTLLLAALMLFLSRYSGQNDIAIGTPVANRANRAIENLIGFFVNTLVLRQNMAQGEEVNPTFLHFLAQVRHTVLDAFEHQDLPFEKLVEDLQPERNLSGSPIFQMMFVYQSAGREELSLPGLDIKPLPLESQEAKFDLLLAMQSDSDQLQGTFEYKTGLFSPQSITKIVDGFTHILEQIASNPQQRLGDYQLLSRKAHQLQVYDWNDNAIEFATDQSIHQLFEHCVNQNPDAIAIEYHEGDAVEQLSYQQLEQRASQLAAHLIKQGAGAEKLIGICMQRKPDMLIAMLAVLKSGAAYVPLDPDYPSARVEQTLTDARVLLLLTSSDLAQRYEGIKRVKSICIDQLSELYDSKIEWDKTISTRVDSENLAYLLYTSGSTGRPKGVAITHRSVLAFIAWAKSVYQPKHFEKVLAGTSICFDLSIFEIFVTLASGGTILLARNVVALAETESELKPGLINTVPSAVDELLKANAMPESVHTVNLAGEPLATELVNRLYAKPHIEKVYDLYGPSEDTTYTTFTLRLANHSPRIGRAIANTQTYVLDKYLQPVPVGIPGELYVGGLGLARGYYDRPELTADKFIPDPFSRQPGARLYRTGDLVSYDEQGVLKYIGRLDHQVKVRGFRIELGEIESLLCSHPQVDECVVITAGAAAASDRHLVAYIKAPALLTDNESGKAPDPEREERLKADLEQSLNNLCLQRLPHFMKPAGMVILPKFPLTPNGKIDRKALPKPNMQRSDRRGVEPVGYIQRTLAALWQDVLNVDQSLYIHDNFFDLGGHSLLVLDLMTQIKVSFGRSLPLSAIFKAPTIAALAELLGEPEHGELSGRNHSAHNLSGHNHSEQSDSTGKTDTQDSNGTFSGSHWSPIVPLSSVLTSTATLNTPDRSAMDAHKPSEQMLFCIHPVGGHVICYNELSRKIGDKMRVYGIKASGMEMEQEIFKNIDMMSDYYLKQIKQIQDQGPYRLLGYSFGGLVAHNIAAMLESHGETVEQLLLLDTAHPDLTQEKTAQTDSAELLVSLFSALDFDLAQLRSMTKEQQLAQVFARAKQAGLVPRAMDDQAIERYFEVCHSNLLMTYAPRTLQVPINLIRAREGDQRVSDDPYLGWQSSALEKTQSVRVDLAWVDGKHEDMLEKPNVEQIAKLIIKKEKEGE